MLSPLLVVLAGFIAAQIAASVDPSTAWMTVAIVYWAAMAVVVLRSTTRRQRAAWFTPSSPRPWWVIPVAIALGVFPATGILAMNLDIVGTHPELWLPWLVFVLLNPLVEETYWRGVLADATSHWPAWGAMAYSTALFVASHPLMWGVFSQGNRSPMTIVSLTMMGVAWFAMRRVTGSLRWPLVSHALVDIGNLSVFVLANAYVPPEFG